MNDIIERLAPEPAEPDPQWAADTLRQIRSSAMPQRRRRRVLVVGAVVGLALGGGAVAAANHGADEKFSRSNPANARAYAQLDALSKLEGPVGIDGQRSAVDYTALTMTPWETNEFGLTVGTPTYGDVVLRNLPDLMPTFIVEGSTQRAGYFRSDESYTYAPNGELEPSSREEHNVYGPDGRTLLGRR